MVELTLLHGFTQDSNVWRMVRDQLPDEWQIDAVDLPGHGTNRSVLVDTPEAFLEAVSGSLAPSSGSTRRVLCGYSMGGRVALGLSAANPERWTDLVIVSSGCGIVPMHSRTSRREADEALATRFLDEGWLEEFASHWDSLQIWEGDPVEVRQARLAMLMQQDPQGLAAALRAFGQGVAPPFTGFAAGEPPALTAVRGSRDVAYVEPCEHLAMLASTAPVVIEGGHSLLLENPGSVAGVIADV